MKKNFVLDTNVLLHDPRSMFRFDDNDVIVPLDVITELDRFKKEPNELGQNARQVSRYIDDLRAKGSLSGDGVLLPGGGSFRVLWCSPEDFKDIPFQDFNKVDVRILALALGLKRDGKCVRVISKDTNLRIMADAVSLESEDYEHGIVPVSHMYTGEREFSVDSQVIDTLYGDVAVSLDSIVFDLFGREEDSDEKTREKLKGYIHPNEFLLLKSKSNEQHSVMVRVDPDKKNLMVLPNACKSHVWGISPLNKEQQYAMELLLDDRVKLVTLVGVAGTGKSLVAVAAGLQKSIDEKVYNKLLVSRPIHAMGKDIGYLPGSIEEKMNPWMQPIFDCIEFLMSLNGGKARTGKIYQEFLDLDLVQIEPLTYIRGRSIPRQFMIVDEVQNLTSHEVKTILSRVGEGTKIVLTGDPHQIDNPYVDATNNGLVHAVNCFKDEGIAGHVTLIKGERSELAGLATTLL